MNSNVNNLGISMRNSADIQAHSISIIKDNRVVSLEDYITEIAGDGGGSGGDGYTQTETDNLLNAKLNVNNPQDIIGNLRLDPTNGNSKIILNAVSPPNASDDFYCNGNAHINGTLRVSVLTSDGDVNCDGVNADVFNSNVITNDIIFNHNDTEYMRFNANDNTVRVPNTRSFLSQNIFTDIIKPLTFSNDVVLNGGNSTNDAYEEYMRLDASDEKVNFSKNIETNEDLIMKSTKVLYLDATANLLRYITTRNDNGQDILELVNNKATNNQIRFTNNASTSLIVDNQNVYTPRQIQGDNGLKVNFIDTQNTNTDFQFRRDGSTAMTLKTGNQIELGGELKLPLTNQFITFDNCKIREGVAGLSFFDFVNEDTSGHFRFYLGAIDNANLKFTLQPTQINLYDHTIINDKLEIVDGYELETNLINSNGDNDLVFQRNGTEFFRLNDQSSLVEVAVGHAVSAPDVYANDYLNRTRQRDTVFYGSVVSADARVEYMRWNYTDQSLDFNAPIDNTNIAVIGNIVDTTVSDERLKTNVQDVESNFTECVKKVKIKTFEYKDEKYKNSDKYGFIAQHLQKHLPKEFDNIVKETKPKKDEGEAYLSINYMKLSIILWGCLQEEMVKREHIESRLFELENIVKEMRGKGKGEKPKAKPKTKSKNVD